ncbi:MAG: hypothetical protein J7K73_03605 [Nanoarchaeota archaeon]|nr:hypothetical protein [Nanoarchaeota archaeon]
MELPYEVSVYWPWVLLAIVIIAVIISLKNKVVRRKLNSLFGWPPEP